MYPVLLRLGPLTIYSFGAMMALAFLTAAYLTGREMDRKGLPAEQASNFVVWAAIGGIVGSRLWAILEDWSSFVREPLAMIFSGSGFVWYGGLIGGTLAVTLAIRRNGLPWLAVVDCIAPGLALGHAIGRIGCQLAGDGDWGIPSDLPWAMAYPKAIIGWDAWLASHGLAADTRVHPTPIYEFLAYSAIFAVLWGLRKRPQPDGTVFGWYLVLAPAARFLVEFVRHNRVLVAGLTEAQVTSLVLMLAGVLLILVRRATAGSVASVSARSAPR